MKKNIKFVCLMMAASTLLVLTACGSGRSISQAKADEAVEIKNIPCSDCLSTKELVRSRAMRESMDQQMAQQMARSSALEELASKINVAVKALVEDYYKSSSVKMNEETQRRFEGLTRQIVDQSVMGYRTICEKYTVSTKNNGAKVFKCYYAVEIGQEELSMSLYGGLSKDDKLHLDYDYEKFKKDFEREMNKADKNR